MSAAEPLTPNEPAIAQPSGNDTPTPPPAAAEFVASKPEDRRETIKEAIAARGNRLRDGAGKFSAAAATPTAAVPVTEPSRPPRHQNYNDPKLEPYWNAAPVELLNRIVARETEMQKGIEPLKGAKAQLDALMNEFKPYETTLQQLNVSPQQAINALMKADAGLRGGSPQQKAQAMLSLMQQYGIPMEHLTNAPPQSPQAQPDPMLQTIAQRVDQLQQFQQRQADDRVNAVISEFAASPDHPHFAQVSEVMAQLLAAPEILGSDASSLNEAQKLQRAYDAAVRLNPELAGSAVAAPVNAAPPNRTTPPVSALQPKNPPSQVRGAPSGAARPKVDPKDRRAVIRNAMANLAR